MRKLIDRTGQKFGRLTVISRLPNDKWNNAVWTCICDCGITKAYAVSSFRSGATKSCGCLSKNSARRRKSLVAEYRTWISMKQRCNNKNGTRYENYGGRGIKVCNRWLKFENFYDDMGNKPSKDYSIDRKDNDGNYEPSNCRWATVTQQNRNQRINKRNKSGISGVHQRGESWRAEIYHKGKHIHLYQGKDLAKAYRCRKAAELKYWA